MIPEEKLKAEKLLKQELEKKRFIEKQETFERLLQQIPKKPKLELPEPVLIKPGIKIEAKQPGLFSRLFKKESLGQELEKKRLAVLQEQELKKKELEMQKVYEKQLLQQQKIELSKQKEIAKRQLEQQKLELLRQREIAKKELEQQKLELSRQREIEKQKQLKELIEKIPPKVKLELPEPPQPIRQPSYKYNVEIPTRPQMTISNEKEIPELRFRKITEAGRYNAQQLPNLEPKPYQESYKSRTYITAGLPSYTRISQKRRVLPMPFIEVVKNYKPNKKIDELKREEQEIYEKLLKLEGF